MLANTSPGFFDAAQAVAATNATAVCNDVRPCFACVLDEFGKDTKPERNQESERLFQLFSVLLTQYINTFGAAMLAAQGIATTINPGRKREKAVQPAEKYTAEEIAGLLRGFGMFYILFKVDAPTEVKDTWWQMSRQLADWMVKRKFVRADFHLSFAPCDDYVKINAVCAAGLINAAAEQDGSLEEDAHDMRCGDPFYVVSRVAVGKLWFLYSPSTGRCAEFGPVVVPTAVANFIKPGWGLDCKFLRVGNRWHIGKVEDVLPI
ncbi:MAG TPA: hypothetical protein V6D22_12580 [Candidatus Obscuribacterales bacterium]